MTIKEFVNAYCKAMNITEDDFTFEDVLFVEDCFYDHATNGTIPSFVQETLDEKN